MVKLDEEIDKIEILLMRLSDEDEQKKVFEEELKQLREEFYRCNLEVELPWITDLMGDLDWRVRVYIDRGEILKKGSHERNPELVELPKRSQRTIDKKIEIYMKMIDNINKMPVMERIETLKKLEKNILDEELFSQILDQKIAERKYEIVIELMQQNEMDLVEKYIKEFDTDMIIYLANKFKGELIDVITAGRIDIAKEMKDYIYGHNLLSEKDIQFWKKIIVPHWRRINNEN